MKQENEYPVQTLCRVFEVSRSSYYAWKSRAPSARAERDEEIKVEIRKIYHKSFETYGSPRVHDQLQKKGISCGKKRVERLMREENIRSVHRRRYRVSTTDSNHQEPVAPNLVNQEFVATTPNEKWGADITYVPTQDGWLYLAVILDFYTRKIVGWAMSDSLRSDFVCHALQMALFRQGFPKELMHHSDRGIQYASSSYQTLLEKHGCTVSMSRTGNPYDNAIVESFMHTLKVECAHRYQFGSHAEARATLADYIERFYNSERTHSALGYLSPCEFEKMKKVA